MANIISTFNNFSRGKLDHDLNGRFELPIYKSGSEIFKNFISDFKGNAKYRTGFENMTLFEDCRLIEFRFSQTQDYLCLFYLNKIKFLSYDVNGNLGFVQSGGGDLEVATPYTLAESKELDFTQNADVMYIVHPNHEPRKLTRVSATSFTLLTFVRTADPFDDPTTGSVGWPSRVEFYEGGLYYGAPTLKITQLNRSKLGDFDDMTVGTGDDDGIEITISDLTEQINFLKAAQNSLMAGSSQGVVPINGGGVNVPITPTNITAKLSQVDGSDETKPINKDGLMFYIKYDRRTIEYFNYNILAENFEGRSANEVSYDITEGRISKLVYKKDKDNLIYCITDDGDLLSLNFNLREKIVGWHKHETEGTFLDISQMYNQDREIQLFAVVERDNGVFIERLADYVEFPLRADFYTGADNKASDDEDYLRFIAEKLKECRYLDNGVVFSDLRTVSITFDGTNTITAASASFVAGDVGKRIVYKTVTGAEVGIFEITAFTDTTHVTVEVLTTPSQNTYASWYLSSDTITGLTDLASETVSVVGDGGFLGEFDVSAGGELELEKQITVAVIGFPYEGLIQSFPLGFQVQLTNTQLLLKNITRSFMRFVFSAGGEFGSDLYRMQEIQTFKTEGAFYDLPPIPMDGTQPIGYTDDMKLDKIFYIRQLKPLPFKVTSVFNNIKYGNKT